jgi:hypothetical protein
METSAYKWLFTKAWMPTLTLALFMSNHPINFGKKRIKHGRDCGDFKYLGVLLFRVTFIGNLT